MKKLFTVLVVCVFVLGPAMRVGAGGLYLTAHTSLGNPSLDIRHITGATEVFDAYDAEYLFAPGPAYVDFYSEVPYDPFKLNKDSRGPDSMSTIHTAILGRGLSGSVDVDVSFMLWTIDGNGHFIGDNFVGKLIYADLFDASDNPLGTWDVRDLADGTETFPTVTVNNGLSYKLDIRFEARGQNAPVPEPSSLTILLAGFTLLRRRRRH